MANKKIDNPCIGGGEGVSPDAVTWLEPRNNVDKTLCPECKAPVTIGRVSKKLRIHNDSRQVPKEVKDLLDMIEEIQHGR